MMRRAMAAAVPFGCRGYAIPINRVCREWRCKVKGEETAEKVEELLESMRGKLPQDATVSRLVCKMQWDYKIQSTVDLETWKEWKGCDFPPEKEFLDELKAIDGVSNVSAQSYVHDAK
eukprot:Sspe_Gene.49692::Locus_26995_Transcript_1_1_Confidence_1.000_Length_488::g.49692::m.49692